MEYSHPFVATVEADGHGLVLVLNAGSAIQLCKEPGTTRNLIHLDQTELENDFLSLGSQNPAE